MIDWCHVNTVYCLMIWIVAFLLAMFILFKAVGTEQPCPSHQVAGTSVCATRPPPLR